MSGSLSQFRSPAATIGFAAAMMLAAGAQGQSVSDFRLPPATATPTARPVGPAGPVDSEHPVVATASPVEPPSPAVTVPPPASPPRPRPAPRAAATPVAAPPAPRAAATPLPAATPSPLPTPPPTVTATATATRATPPAPPLAPPPAAPAPEPASTSSWWWLGAAALAGVLGTALAILRARRRSGPMRDEELAAPASAPTPAPPVSPSPPPSPSAPSARRAPATAGPELALEPVRLSLSLVNATLHYRLRLTNYSAAALGPVSLAADMIAAHASLSDDSQLARDGGALEPRHRFPGLPPGESVDVGGDLRLPLAEITPIRSGGAALLVPLLRLRIESGAFRETRVMVIGEAPAQAGGMLRPFRLDHGPRIFSALVQHELER